jgi:hypothetical protein
MSTNNKVKVSHGRTWVVLGMWLHDLGLTTPNGDTVAPVCIKTWTIAAYTNPDSAREHAKNASAEDVAMCKTYLAQTTTQDPPIVNRWDPPVEHDWRRGFSPHYQSVYAVVPLDMYHDAYMFLSDQAGPEERHHILDLMDESFHPYNEAIETRPFQLTCKFGTDISVVVGHALAFVETVPGIDSVAFDFNHVPICVSCGDNVAGVLARHEAGTELYNAAKRYHDTKPPGEAGP